MKQGIFTFVSQVVSELNEKKNRGMRPYQITVTSLLTNAIDTRALKHSIPVPCLCTALHHQLFLLGKADRTMVLRQYAMRKKSA